MGYIFDYYKIIQILLLGHWNSSKLKYKVEH